MSNESVDAMGTMRAMDAVGEMDAVGAMDALSAVPKSPTHNESGAAAEMNTGSVAGMETSAAAGINCGRSVCVGDIHFSTRVIRSRNLQLLTHC